MLPVTMAVGRAWNRSAQTLWRRRAPAPDHDERSPPALRTKAWKNGSRYVPLMIEPLLCGIVLGLIPVTLVGLFVAAWNQYQRGNVLEG